MRYFFLLLFLMTSMPVLAQETEETLNLNPQEPVKEAAEKKASEDTPEPASEEGQDNPENKPAPAKVEVTEPTATLELYENDIKAYLNSDVVQPMMAGPDDFITLLQPDLHPTDKGVVIMLPEWHQTATSPKAINYLRKQLPNEGWATIVLQPIEKPDAYPSRADKKSARDEENEAALLAYKEKLIPMMTAIFEKAQDYPGIFVVVAEGNNAAILLDLFEQQQLPLPNALVMLSAHMLNETDNRSFALQVAESELPILDLYLTSDNTWVHHFVKLRRQYAHRELKTYYRQRQFRSFAPGYYPEQDLRRAIKGWLTSIGW